MGTSKEEIALPDIFQYSATIFMFKYENNLLPNIFNNLFSCNKDFHNYNTRNQNKIRHPKIKTKLAERFIMNMGPKFWNQIEGKINKKSSLTVFKKILLDYIIKDYGNDRD